VLGSEDNKLSNKITVKLVASIASNGQIVILEGGNEVDAGILLPDGTLDIRLHGARKTFSTTIDGPRIRFLVDDVPVNTFDD
jgi:hypothetical protein